MFHQYLKLKDYIAKTARWQWLNPIVIFGSFLISVSVGAQITPDNSLGTSQSIVTPSTINGTPSKRIDGGLGLGKNQLHSFQEFNVVSGRGAYFSNPSGINAILVRVTGSSSSSINGKLGVLGNADLFFLNPNGILLGRNVSLNLNGSFIGSTAKDIVFSDGSKFGNSNLLKFPSPNTEITGLYFDKTSGNISADGNGHNLSIPNSGGITPLVRDSNLSGLRIKGSNTIGLVARNLLFDGATVASMSGNIELGGVRDGVVNIDKNQSRWFFSYKQIQDFGNISLLDSAFIDSTGDGSNSINIAGGNIRIDNGSVISVENSKSQIESNESFDNTLQVKASGSITINEVSQNGDPVPSGLSSTILNLGQGPNIQLSASSLNITNGGRIAAVSFGPGNGGSLDISTTDDILVSSSSIANPVSKSVLNSTAISSGKGGNVRIQSKNLTISDGGLITSVTLGTGMAGSIDVFAQDIVSLFGLAPPTLSVAVLNPRNSNLNSSTFSSGLGGDLHINSKSLFIRDGGSVGTGAFSSGNAGNIFINTEDSITISDVAGDLKFPSLINASSFGEGSSGDLSIKTKNLNVLDGGGISVNAVSSGNAGRLNIEASDSVTVKGSFSKLLPSSIGSGAAITDPQITDFLNLPNTPTGRADGIRLNTQLLILKDGGRISVQNDGPNDAGDLSINADQISIDNASLLATAFGDGGNINILANVLSLNNSTISTTTEGDGVGGNIAIKTELLVGFGENSISANAISERGGNIQIDTLGFFPSPKTKITATSEAGPQLDGTFTLNTQRTGAEETTAPAPDLKTSPQVTSACNPSTGTGKFVMMGPGALRVEPHNLVAQSSELGIPATSLNSKPESIQITKKSSMTEATGWKKQDGKLMLIARKNTNSTHAFSNSQRCNRT